MLPQLVARLISIIRVVSIPGLARGDKLQVKNVVKPTDSKAYYATASEPKLKIVVVAPIICDDCNYGDHDIEELQPDF